MILENKDGMRAQRHEKNGYPKTSMALWEGFTFYSIRYRERGNIV